MQESQDTRPEVDGAQTKRATLAATGSVGTGATLIGMFGWGPTGLFFTGLATAALLALEYHGTPEEYAWMRRHLAPVLGKVRARRTSHLPEPKNVDAREYEQASKVAPIAAHQQPRATLPPRFTLSDVLATGFLPSLDQIFLAYGAEDGAFLWAAAKGLCHVALAGSTGLGKSVLMRLLMAQLCYAGAQVLLLNPHYTRYDIQAEPPEDWTPYEPYLVDDPMRCRSYEVIEYYLRHVALELLPQRLERHANSQPIGTPYFLVIDELPAIASRIKAAHEYLAAILREGRKVGIYLIAASQDFLVSTIGGSGAVRDCFRTAYYVGGDPTTAKVLLDMPAREIPESELGQGTVMVRGGQAKQAQLSRVPYVDNAALYRLLGPSTYRGGQASAPDDVLRAYGHENGQQESERTGTGHFTKAIPERVQAALAVYTPGMGCRPLARALHCGKDQAMELLRELRERRLIEVVSSEEEMPDTEHEDARTPDDTRESGHQDTTSDDREGQDND